MPQVPGPGQGRPAVIPAVTTVIATVAAIRTFIQAATALRRSQARVPLSLGTRRSGPVRAQAPGPGPASERSGVWARPSAAWQVRPLARYDLALAWSSRTPHTALRLTRRRSKRRG